MVLRKDEGERKRREETLEEEQLSGKSPEYTVRTSPPALGSAEKLLATLDLPYSFSGKAATGRSICCYELLNEAVISLRDDV